MAFTPCRAALGRNSRPATRQLIQCARSYATETTQATNSTPESFKLREEATVGSTSSQAAPRWSQTPQGMKAPVQMDFARNPKNKVWHVNSSPEKLDAMYNRLLGPAGSKMLPEELKWLAVTHKSFDQGRRGFNDRLALMGRLTLQMEVTKNIISKEPLEGSKIVDEFDRVAFENDRLASVDNLNVQEPKQIIGKDKLYKLATSVGMLDVLRWKPRQPERLDVSGVEVVLNGAVFAIIGAITLQRGLDVAAGVVREHILPKLK